MTLLVSSGSTAFAQTTKESVRTGRFAWSKTKATLQASVSFREVFTVEVLRKLRLGLPTTIVLTALLTGGGKSLGSSFQRCKVTWHVWEEMYRIEISRSGQPKVGHSWSANVNGVLRRCAEADRLPVAMAALVPLQQPLTLHARVLVNPVSPQLLEKIKRWISRPSGSTGNTSASKLFSTFTGLFLTRVGEAERELKFRTRPAPAPPK